MDNFIKYCFITFFVIFGLTSLFISSKDDDDEDDDLDHYGGC
jgi:hypothetical protein